MEKKTMSLVRVDIILRNLIKPATPTPPHLHAHKLSLIDQFFSPDYYANMIYFFPCNAQNRKDVEGYVFEKSKCLQKSLSETLVQFYPMAGRLRNASFVECNDEGAVFMEARIGCSLRNFLSTPNTNLLSQFVPTNDPNNILLASGCLLFIQLTIFDCGGMALSVCPSHALVDAYSLTIFARAWTATTRGYGASVVPEFIGASLLPPAKSPLTIAYPARNLLSRKCVTNRFVFDGFRIESLRTKIGGELGMRHHLSRLSIVLALILKYAIRASQRVPGPFRTSVLFQLASFRKKLAPRLPKNAMGNHVLMYVVLFKDHNLDLSDMVAKMKDRIKNFYNGKLNRINGNEAPKVVIESLIERAELMKKPDSVIYKCSSICGISLYDIDFGLGEPTWVTSLIYFSNQIVLFDTRCGSGIEAWITLEEQEMALFQCDKELLEYASINPGIFVPYSQM